MYNKYIRKIKNVIYPIIKNIMFYIGKIIILNSYSKKTPHMEKIKKILFVHIAYLGDTLFTTPVISEMKKKYPNIEIYYLTYTKNFNMLENNRDIKELLDFANVTKSEINEYKFDIAIDFTSNFKTISLLLKTNIPYRVGTNTIGLGFLFSKNVKKPNGHLIKQYFSFVRSFGIEYHNNKPKYFISEKEKETSKEWIIKHNIKKPIIVIHISAGWEAKRWNIKNFNKIINNFPKINFIIIGAKEDEFLYNKLKIKYNNVYAFFGTNIRLSSAIIGESDLFIGHDSFPLFIAEALNVSSISLFGPTNPRFSAPKDLTKHEVIFTNVKCRPKNNKQYCNTYAGREGCNDYICMKNIMPSEVIKIIKKKKMNENIISR